jgi:CRP-like cAMP-binding protein
MSTPTPPAAQKLEEFFSHYTLVRYDKNERMLRENESPSGIYFVREGIVRTYLISEEGNELTVLLQPTQSLFPLRWAVNELPNIYNYQAMNPVELWRAPREAFQEFLQANPDVLMHITKSLVEDCSALIYRMQHTVFGNAYAKVAAVVLTAGKRFGEEGKKPSDVEVKIHLTHQQIADSAGITRETASLEMKKLKDNGLIEYHGRSLVILDMQQLSKASFL